MDKTWGDRGWGGESGMDNQSTDSPPRGDIDSSTTDGAASGGGSSDRDDS